MDKTVPAGAALLLDFIGSIEAPRGYDTIYGNNQGKLAKPLTTMTLDEVEAAQGTWSKRFGSSAAGRYQFMKNTLDAPKTLRDIEGEMRLSGKELFAPDLQDRMAFHLLERRGYGQFVAGQISAVEFGKRLAQEWASLPVLASTKGGSRDVVRGQSYYAGDGLNKSLVKPERVEALLEQLRSAPSPIPAPPDIEPIPAPAKSKSPAGAIILIIILAAAIGAAFFLFNR